MNVLLDKWVNYWELLCSFTWRNIQIKYKQTFFGFLWAIFMPVVIVFAGVIMKIALAHIYGHSVEPGQISSIAVKALPWSFFIGALKFSVSSLISNMAIIKRVKFPRVIFPISYTFSQFFDFLVGSVAFIFLFVYLKIGVSPHLFWSPFLILFLVLFTSGLGMIFSAGNLFYRDVKYVIDVVLTFAIFFTPVFFDAASFGKLKTLVLLNPVSSILECLNITVVLHQPPPMHWFLYAGGFSIFTFVFGWIIFHKTEPAFAEYI